MELKELKKKTVSDLHSILAEQRNKLRELRFKDANKQLKDVRQIRKTRTIIAQVLTLLKITNTDDIAEKEEIKDEKKEDKKKESKKTDSK